MGTRGRQRRTRTAIPSRTGAIGVVVLLAATLLSAPHAAADHTPAPSVVTLVGSLQFELGCPDDWQPDCAATVLEPVPGSPGKYSTEFDVPAGAWEYKVALNGTWAENYGAGGAAGGANIPLQSQGGLITFTYDHATHAIEDSLPDINSDSSAQWVRRDLIALDLANYPGAVRFRLYWADEGGLAVDGDTVTGGDSAELTLASAGLPVGIRRDLPHLASYEALRVPPQVRRQLDTILTGQVAVAAFTASGELVDVTGVQIAEVLDDAYGRAERESLGVTWRGATPTVSVWAPTAKSVSLLLQPAGATAQQQVDMRRDRDGVWSVTGRPSWRNATYLFQVTVYAPTIDAVAVNLVTDPYSLALTTNSERSVIVDLQDPSLIPLGWASLAKPDLPAPEYSTIYELHVRDFSISDDTVTDPDQRGTYLAFTDAGSAGMRHLRELADAGLNTVHLLPVNDIATIEENRARQLEPQCDLPAMPPDSEQQQECVTAVASRDGFNWGYDPLHYTTPEGSYAVNPDGPGRTREFRQMVQGLNGAGLRVVLDVVYNHTPASGQDPKSILDRIVPGYYQRLSLTGQVETSTCCANTATEHVMMEKLMVDSVLTWAREYKVDGFRFDLMGHQPKESMEKLRRELDRLTIKRDGVDGKRIYIYGEGWNFGEVANDQRFVQATQLNMAGTGIGTFNDRLRDAVRGGGPFDENPRTQGFASGLSTDPNGDPINGTEAEKRIRLLLYQDQIKVGLAGNLKDYTFVDRTGATVTGSQVPYNGQPTGYAADPQETVNYVEAHDNETLYDVLAYKLPQSTPMDQRIRMQTLALATTVFSQAVSFWHAGGDILRSKSLDRNSYDSGDWFNILDWSYATNGFGRGLPPRPDNEAKWAYMRPLLADPAFVPAAADIELANAVARDLLRIRASSPLFHLTTADQVQQKVSFPVGGPEQPEGVIVMTIDDTVGRDVDPALRKVVVIFNADHHPTTQAVPAATGAGFQLHPVQAQGADPVVKTSVANADGTFTVPARTVAVFVAP